jgi:hypothetical protein
MSSPSHTSPKREPREPRIPPAGPPKSAFFLGALLILVIGSAIAILFLISPSNFSVSLPRIGIRLNIDVPLSTVVAASGATIGVIGLIFLVSGNARRLRLINDFTASAYELAASLDARADRSEERYFPDEIHELRDYEDALLRLGAYEHARLVSRLIRRNLRRFPYIRGISYGEDNGGD